ncbi:rifin PIR protein, putative [Plasmodium reichenowi]|uniref:Rifin PIR protein, putative n=1 Tax=Plasmodium reichenowi TaxID=5854 RepID=A0A2P9DCB4_PLARE|nr:rifin PIR protein, putative [Plasmodium reichenowi]
MKVHYINILLCALPLNILGHNKNKQSIIPHYTKSNRFLCEWYAPANYDSDPQMKRVMQQFEDRTTQRFHAYDNRMIEKRKQCKDQCDKEIQKIILKDKLEKELMDKFATLHTDIQSDAIPTCMCEKSLADKTEKFCLNCGVNVGGGIAPSVGLLGGLGTYAWKPAAITAAEKAAKAAAIAAGKAAGEAAGKKVVIGGLEFIKVDVLFPEIYKTFVTTKPYTEVTKLAPAIVSEYNKICAGTGTKCSAQWIEFGYKVGIHGEGGNPIYGTADNIVPNVLNTYISGAKTSAATEAARVTTSETPVLQARYTAAVETTYGGCQTAIIASVVAIVVIVLIMVIIYLILRYRRKKKMKKKLQYIKLLEE